MTLMGWVLKMEETLYDFLICSWTPCNVRTSLNLKKVALTLTRSPVGWSVSDTSLDAPGDSFPRLRTSRCRSRHRLRSYYVRPACPDLSHTTTLVGTTQPQRAWNKVVWKGVEDRSWTSKTWERVICAACEKWWPEETCWPLRTSTALCVSAQTLRRPTQTQRRSNIQ